MLPTTPKCHTSTIGFAAAAVALLASTLLLTAGASPALAAPGRAYATNPGSDTVSVVDTATNAVVTVIPVGDRPADLAVSPDGSRVYVVNEFSGTVSVIDTASNTVVATVPVGPGPRSVTLTPNGARAWVTTQGSTTVIDTATNTVVGTVPALPMSLDVAFSPDGARAYGTGQNSLVVVDTATFALVAERPVGPFPSVVEVSPDGTRVYVVGNRNLRVFDTATNTQLQSVDLPSEALDFAVSPDGTRLYVAQYFPGSVLVLDATTLAVLATVPIGNHVWGLGVSPSGDRVYAAVGPVTSEGLVVIDAASNTVVGIVAMPTPEDVVVTSTTPAVPPAPVIEGATFYTDGTSSRSGVAPGSRVSLFTSSGIPGMAYRLVLSRDGCRTVVAFLNPTTRFATNQGVIGPTAGNVPAGTAPGRYQICFLAPSGSGATMTGAVTLDVV